MRREPPSLVVVVVAAAATSDSVESTSLDWATVVVAVVVVAPTDSIESTNRYHWRVRVVAVAVANRQVDSTGQGSTFHSRLKAWQKEVWEASFAVTQNYYYLKRTTADPTREEEE